ncbi:MAG: glycosyltransferase family 2 protein [Chitinophagales bacterium]|nr:glycosyltransferase family 2 protein [Chitinophagales bacterium]MCO5279572.1 glycosyltransferase family 2 protein [Chitinophagales bacterium]OJV24207.1 MAG: glycosyltransferase [Bacteroidetes bacterium 37-13]HRN94749.1 glycosyltransferase family 2 protein [Chitinophagales bacterium]HRP40022.1 glycosyltransferase family 2 protein [Chitinophagales bacterium]
MNISVIVPLLNEEESLPELAKWIERVMLENNFTFEVIFVDDGSKDNSWKIIQEISQSNSNFKGIKFKRNYGKSAALFKGFEAAQGDVVITMDADLQDSPDEIPELYRLITEENYDLISGWKQKRYDPISKTIPTKIYNGTTRLLTGIQLHDMNCGLKSYKNEVVKSIEVYGEMHRYIPVLAKRAGYGKIGEKVVHHQARKYGSTKFGIERFLYGFLDLLSVIFITRFAKRPMHIFGGLGVLSFFIGFCILLYLTFAKYAFEVYRMTERPIFYFGLISIIIGVQLFLAGFLAELISRSASNRNEYDITKKIGIAD